MHRKVDFVELMNRLAMYRGEEAKAVENTKKNAGADCTEKGGMKCKNYMKKGKQSKGKNSDARTACRRAQKEL